MANDVPFSVLMVCMGNICRSPTAHGVLRDKIAARGWQDWMQVDSCGTHDYHVGAPPDGRAQVHARRRGYDLSTLRARQLTADDFQRHDLVLVMDADNLRRAQAVCPPGARTQPQLLTGFCRHHQAKAVPDPYYGGDAGFEQVLDLIEDACEGVLDSVAKQRRPA